MFPYDQVYREIRAQYDRFVELTGKKPGYLHAHSLGHEHYNEAIQQVSRESGIPYSADLHAKYNFGTLFGKMMEEMKKNPATQSKVFDPMLQLNKNPLKNVLDNKEYILEHEYFMIGGHPGYVDDDLLGLTTLSLERVKDAAMCMSEELKQFIEESGIELITYYDLY